MQTITGQIESVDFENPDYTLVTFRVPVQSAWSIGQYTIQRIENPAPSKLKGNCEIAEGEPYPRTCRVCGLGLCNRR